MGNKLFSTDGVDIAKTIAQELGPRLLPLRLVKVTPGTRTAGSSTSGTNPTTRSFPCRGMRDDTQLSRFPETLVGQATGAVLILGDTLPTGVVPAAGDRVLVEGSEVPITGQLARDPDAAAYLMGVRG